MMVLEFVCFVFKEFSAAFTNMAKSSMVQFRQVLVDFREMLLQVLCHVGENKDVVIRNMA